MTDSGNDTLAPTAMTDADLAELRETLGLCGGMTLVLQERIDRKTHVPCKDGWSWPIQEVEKRLDTMFRALPGALAELARLRGEVARLQGVIVKCAVPLEVIFAVPGEVSTGLYMAVRAAVSAIRGEVKKYNDEHAAPAPGERAGEDGR